MLSEDVWNVVLAILASLGGGGIIVAGLAQYVGKIWAERIAERLRSENAKDLERVRSDFLKELEGYKARLRKSELIFEKEVEAASAFVAMVNSIYPEHSRPEMDFHDACDDIAMSFSAIEGQLKSYLLQYGAILVESDRGVLEQAIVCAADGKFEIADPEEVSMRANQLAEKLYGLLRKLELSLISRVRDQAGQ